MIYLFLNSLQNFLQHKVVLHDHQIMKSIIILKINDNSKFAVHWVDGKNLQCSHALGLQIGFLVAMEKRAVSYTTSIIIEYIFIRPYTNVLECLTYWFSC